MRTPWLVVCLLAVAGCAGPIINTPSPARPRISAQPGATILMSRIRAPAIIVAGTEAQMLSGYLTIAGPTRISEMSTQLRRLLGESGAVVMDERDVGDAPPAPGTFVMRVDVTAYNESTSWATTDMMACGIFGGLTAGLGFLACVDTRSTTYHTAEVEVRVYDASGARVERITRAGEIELAVDTTDRRPLLSRQLRIEMVTGFPLSGPPSGPELDRFVREQGTRLAELIHAEIADNLQSVLSYTPPAGVAAEMQSAPAELTSGGEAPVAATPTAEMPTAATP